MRRFREILRLIRVENCLLAAVGVLVGAYLCWLRPVYAAPALAALAAFFLCAAGNVVNDLVDIQIDRINHPRRVLVRGVFTRQFAAGLAVGCNVVGLLLALSVNRVVLIVAAGVALLLLVYNFGLKRIALVGNIVIAVLGAMTFLTGGLAVDADIALALPGPLIGAVFAFFFHLVREIIKDVQDINGDRTAGVTTLPHVIGVRPSLTLALLLFVTLVLLTYIPVLYRWFGTRYQIIAVYVVDLPLLLLLILVWGSPTTNMLKIAGGGLKVGMALGLVALVLA